MAAGNSFALLASEESQDVDRFIQMEKALVKEAAARKKRDNELAKKERQAAALRKQRQIDRATKFRMMKAKRIVLPSNVRSSDNVSRKEKESNNRSGVEKTDGSVQNKAEQNGYVQNTAQQNGYVLSNADYKSDGVVSQGADSSGGVANNKDNGSYRRVYYGGGNNYNGRYRHGNYYGYGNGYWRNKGGQNNGYRSGRDGLIAENNLPEKQQQEGDNAEEEGWKYVGMPRSRSRAVSRDRRGAYGLVNNRGFRERHHRYYNVNGYNRRRYRRDGEIINGDNTSNEAEKKVVTEDNKKTDSAQGAVCEPTEDQKEEVNGQKASKSKQAEEYKLKNLRQEKVQKLKEERVYDAKFMTLQQYEKALSMKKETLDGLRQTQQQQQQQRMVILDKEFESMHLLKKKNEADNKSEEDHLKKKKDGLQKHEKAHTDNSPSLVANFRFPKPANNANYSQPYDSHPRNGYRPFPANANNGEKPFSGSEQQDERLNPNSMNRPRNSSRNFPRQQERKPVLDTDSERDFPALPGNAKP